MFCRNPCSWTSHLGPFKDSTIVRTLLLYCKLRLWDHWPCALARGLHVSLGRSDMYELAYGEDGTQKCPRTQKPTPDVHVYTQAKWQRTVIYIYIYTSKIMRLSHEDLPYVQKVVGHEAKAWTHQYKRFQRLSPAIFNTILDWQASWPLRLWYLNTG